MTEKRKNKLSDDVTVGEMGVAPYRNALAESVCEKKGQLLATHCTIELGLSKAFMP